MTHNLAYCYTIWHTTGCKNICYIDILLHAFVTKLLIYAFPFHTLLEVTAHMIK